MSNQIANGLLNAIPLEDNIIKELLKKYKLLCTDRWSTTKPTTPGDKLREAAKIACTLSAHYSVCASNLLENADEADMNQRMGEERRRDNPPPEGE